MPLLVADGWRVRCLARQPENLLPRVPDGVEVVRGDLKGGDTLDCWHVESIQPGQRLCLVAEMKLPGRAWLDFEVQPDGDGTRLPRTTPI